MDPPLVPLAQRPTATHVPRLTPKRVPPHRDRAPPARSSVSLSATITRSLLLGADYYEADDDVPARGDNPRIGIGRDVVLERVIVDKNARIGDGASLTNTTGVQHADGDGYYIRDGIVIVPKDGVIKPGTRV